MQCCTFPFYFYEFGRRLVDVSVFLPNSTLAEASGKIALSFASPEKEKYFLFIYELITWEKEKLRCRIYYSYASDCS
jgi:hypothetical protein